MSNATEITCPSGLSGELRLIKVKDEELFTNQQLARTGRLISKLLENCWIDTKDMGPYMGETPVWQDVLSADRTFALIQLRILSYGTDYRFKVQCQACDMAFTHEVQLHELEVAKVSEEGRAWVTTEKPAEIILYDDTKVLVRPMTGEDEEFLAKIPRKESHKILTYQLARRIVKIGDAEHWTDIVEAVEDMPARLADDLWDKTDDFTGGVDTLLLLECPHCGMEQQVALPFEAGFFSNRKRFSRSMTQPAGS